MNSHTHNSSFREKLIEHLFIGELLRLSWLNRWYDLEISKPEVDNAGYDLIAESSGIVRHVQLKTSFTTSKTARQKVHMKLAEKPSGCVIWIRFDENTLSLGPFYFFGGNPGEPLLGMESFRIAKHTKGNREGYKAERPMIREINKGEFKKVSSFQELYALMFGHK